MRLVDGREVAVTRATWELFRYRGGDAPPAGASLASATRAPRMRVAATMRQVPLRLAWALTIHVGTRRARERERGGRECACVCEAVSLGAQKCQGMSLDAVHVDLSRAFEDGMAYTALSR
jgi:ATP-dependent exoDNAse (exonuclease V) alpha subunit